MLHADKYNSSKLLSNSSPFFRGLAATALSPLVNALIQIGSVPLFLHIWGVQKYGDWILISTLPTYLSMSNMGFGDASGSDMTLRMATDDRRGSLATFQSSWLLLNVLSILFLLLVASLTFTFHWESLLNLSSTSRAQACSALFLLSVYVLLSQQSGIIESGFRCDGNFALGVASIAGLRLLEATSATVVAMVGGGFVAVALTYCVARGAGTIVYGLLLLKKSPWLKFGFECASWEVIRQLALPASGFLILSIGMALNLQGFTLIVGVLLGPIAVVSFSTTRTLTRISYQVVNMLSVSMWPELSGAFGRGDIKAARGLHRGACQAALMLSSVFGGIVWVSGPWIYRVWSGHAVPLNQSCFHILLLAVLVNSLWYISLTVPMSNNTHSFVSLAYLGSALVTLGIAAVLSKIFDVSGAAFALLLFDLTMAGIVLRVAMTRLEDTPGLFVLALLNPLPWVRKCQRLRPIAGG